MGSAISKANLSDMLQQRQATCQGAIASGMNQAAEPEREIPSRMRTLNDRIDALSEAVASHLGRLSDVAREPPKSDAPGRPVPGGLTSLGYQIASATTRLELILVAIIEFDQQLEL